MGGGKYLATGFSAAIEQQRAKQRWEQGMAEHASQREAVHLGILEQAHDDACLLEHLLEQPDLWECHRKVFSEWLDYLRGGEGRTLNTWRRRRLVSVIRARKLAAIHGTTKTEAEWKESKKDTRSHYTKGWRKKDFPGWLKGEGATLPPRPPRGGE